ncbi:MAG TPA: ROK family protein [Terriglobia bacterium]|nr:ROK family protein [Terriglobia bacterium]
MAKKADIIVGVDMGGTSVKALVVDGKNRILAVEKMPTDRAQKSRGLIADIAALVARAIHKSAAKRSVLCAVSIGAPGAIDPKAGMVRKAPNLGWQNVPLGRELGKLVRVPVLVDNDVNVGVVGEHAFGAGERVDEMTGIFVGTGIGGGIISKGRLFEGSSGAAGEVGHTVLLVDGPLCSCGHHGCAEALASRTAMERDVRAAIKAGRKTAIPEIMKQRHKDRMTSSVIHAALKAKDPLMREVMGRAQYYLGILVANVVNLLDPERVIIGGGLAERMGEEFVQPIRRNAYEYFLRQADTQRVKIVPGSLGDNAGALGAVVLARQRLKH